MEGVTSGQQGDRQLHVHPRQAPLSTPATPAKLARLMVKKLPSDLLIFSESTLTNPLCTQYRTKSWGGAPPPSPSCSSCCCWWSCKCAAWGSPQPQQGASAARDCASSFSWWGNTRSLGRAGGWEGRMGGREGCWGGAAGSGKLHRQPAAGPTPLCTPAAPVDVDHWAHHLADHRAALNVPAWRGGKAGGAWGVCSARSFAGAPRWQGKLPPCSLKRRLPGAPHPPSPPCTLTRAPRPPG